MGTDQGFFGMKCHACGHTWRSDDPSGVCPKCMRASFIGSAKVEALAEIPVVVSPLMPPGRMAFTSLPTAPNTPLLRMAAADVVRAWERLGACEDEFGDYGLAQSSCGEYADALDTAIIALKGCLPKEQSR
jgi:hypothetical protein